MKNCNEEIGEDGFLEESQDQVLYGKYQLSVELTKLNYTENQIAIQLCCEVEELQKIKAMFE